MSHDWSALTVNTGQLKMCLLAPASLVFIRGRFCQLSQIELFFSEYEEHRSLSRHLLTLSLLANPIKFQTPVPSLSALYHSMMPFSLSLLGEHEYLVWLSVWPWHFEISSVYSFLNHLGKNHKKYHFRLLLKVVRQRSYISMWLQKASFYKSFKSMLWYSRYQTSKFGGVALCVLLLLLVTHLI